MKNSQKVAILSFLVIIFLSLNIVVSLANTLEASVEDNYYFTYNGYKRLWSSGLQFVSVSNSLKAVASNWSEYYNGGWNLWKIDKMRTWVKMTNPYGRSWSDDVTLYNTYSCGTYVGPYQFYTGTWSTVSTHRYWEGSLYRYKSLSITKYFSTIHD